MKAGSGGLHRLADAQQSAMPVMDFLNPTTSQGMACTSRRSATAKAAITTTPIVFYVGGDPVELGLVAGLNQPDGNLTGVTALASEVGPKRLELVH
jgi:putative ABC transport system substrate-binding protein